MPDATIALDYMLAKLEWLVRTLRVLPRNMERNLQKTHGLIHSQQVLLALIKGGITREAAYKIVQDNAMKAWETEQDLKQLLLADPRVTAQLKPSDLDIAFDLAPHFKDVKRTFKAVGL